MNLDSEIRRIEHYVSNATASNRRLFVSSSFQSHSIPLLHIISRVDKSIPICFLETGFHFAETRDFRDKVTNLLELNLTILQSTTLKINQRDSSGRFFFCSNSEYCCHLNKVLPLAPILQSHDVWITGVRRDQNQNRKQMQMEAKGPYNTIRYHPMLDWSAKMIWAYRKKYELPTHPLEKQGFLSIGCEPCTEKFTTDERSSRWSGQSKTECGLHTDLLEK